MIPAMIQHPARCTLQRWAFPTTFAHLHPTSQWRAPRWHDRSRALDGQLPGHCDSARRPSRWPLGRRAFSKTAISGHGHIKPPTPGEEIHVTFVDKEGDEHKYEVASGDNLLDIAQENDLEMEGACGGSCACSTCHVIVDDQAMYDRIPEPDDEENDMLDLAFGLTETSRLGCQVKMRPELDGLRVRLPSMTRNLQQSDFSR